MGWSALAPEVCWTLGAILGVLVVSSAIVALLRRAKPDRDLENLRQRVNTWWLMVIVFTAAMIVSRTVSLVFFALISCLALKEYLALISTGGVYS